MEVVKYGTTGFKIENHYQREFILIVRYIHIRIQRLKEYSSYPAADATILRLCNRDGQTSTLTAARMRAILDLGAALSSQLNNKGTTLDGVDKDVTGLEVSIRRPGTDKGGSSSTRKIVVLGINVEPRSLANLGSRRILGNGTAVEDSETSTVVGLVDVVFDDILVVVDKLGGMLEVASLLGVLEIANVPDEGNGETVSSRAVAVLLVKLIVKDKELLVVGVKKSLGDTELTKAPSFSDSFHSACSICQYCIISSPRFKLTCFRPIGFLRTTPEYSIAAFLHRS